MQGRRLSYPKRRIRSEAKSFVRINALLLLLVAGVGAAAAVMPALVLDGFLAGIVTGLLLATVLGMVALSFLLVSGTTFQLSGVLGESNTTDCLRAAKRRGLIFEWVDSLEVASGDVDHLVITRAGILAIDSKWHSHGVTAQRLENDARAAQAAAQRARSILRSVNHRRPVVSPLVVVWGGDQTKVAGHHSLGVEFVPGRDLKNWLKIKASEGNAFNKAQAAAMADELRAFKRRVSPSDFARPTTPTTASPIP